MHRRPLGFAAVAALSLCAFSTAVGSVAAGCGDGDDRSAVTPGPDATTPIAEAGTDTGPAPNVDAGVDTGPTTLDVTVTFAARVGTLPFACSGTFPGLGTTSATIAPSDFRFYVHAVELLRDGAPAVPLALVQDGKWQKDDLALLDFEDGSMGCAVDGNPDLNAVVKGQAPAGTYKGLRFVLGVPFAKNHQNQAIAASPLNVGKLFWSWNSGYLFAKIEGQAAGTDGGAPYPPFLVHIGSTGCTGDAADGGVLSCARPNRATVTLPTYEIGKTVVVDYATLVAGSDLYLNGSGAPGCMSFPGDPECPAIFERLGLDYPTGMPLATSGAAFKVE